MALRNGLLLQNISKKSTELSVVQENRSEKDGTTTSIQILIKVLLHSKKVLKSLMLTGDLEINGLKLQQCFQEEPIILFKNYFYATVRRHLRKLNKCLRTQKFCEAFNLEQKQVKINFLIDSLENGNLNFFEIRAIENKELISLSKKKCGVYSKKLKTQEKNILHTLDGKGKPIDKNLKLLKELLTLVDCDLEKQQDDEEDEDSSEELKSISIKNVTARDEIVNETINEPMRNKRFK